MRERNNEASKRCRLKRRMKAVSMENQSSMLNMANKMLKKRIQRLEHVGAALQEGVNKIQAGQYSEIPNRAGGTGCAGCAAAHPLFCFFLC